MSTRTITGNRATDPEAVQAGRVQIVKLRVIENAGEYRGGEWTPHEAPTTHFVKAKFELGEHVLVSLHEEDAVIVVGYERTVSWGEGENRRTGRVLEADAQRRAARPWAPPTAKGFLGPHRDERHG